MGYSDSFAAQNLKMDCGSYLEDDSVVSAYLQAEASRLTLIKRYSHPEPHISVVDLAWTCQA